MCVISHKNETSNNLNLNIGKKNSQTANMVNNFEGKNLSETLFGDKFWQFLSNLTSVHSIFLCPSDHLN